MQVPVEALSMKKSERLIIRLFSELSMKKRNRVVDVLNDMVDVDVDVEEDENENRDKYIVSDNVLKMRHRALKNMYAVSEQSLKERDEAKARLDVLCHGDDGTRGDCEPEASLTKEQLDRELDEYMASDPRSLPHLKKQRKMLWKI